MQNFSPAPRGAGFSFAALPTWRLFPNRNVLREIEREASPSTMVIVLRQHYGVFRYISARKLPLQLCDPKAILQNAPPRFAQRNDPHRQASQKR